MGTEAPSVTDVIERFEKMLIGWQQMVEFKPEVANHGIAECTIVLAALKAYHPDAEPVAEITINRERRHDSCMVVLDAMQELPSGKHNLYAAPSAAPGWVAVGPGTMPKDGDEALVSGFNSQPETGRWHFVAKWSNYYNTFIDGNGESLSPYTHYQLINQSLPAPPTGAAS